MKLTLLRDYPNGRYAMTFDVIIVGGSYAGISAGMQLARA
ncbi:thioredoxin reductase, partial [Pseudomonas aeruginosa]|nr:thioredoxin reductase [Pseudomonas aeruginosa]MDQ4362742.1 thioredoxin reductase [Pseudomonas aeruginosa]MDQ4394304.1 thioredoxin reductase [Pseudomonas aeruginosa]